MHATSPPQIFTTTTWTPKERSCFFGRSTEDVHTWISLVHHYLAFMAGFDAQQVAYSLPSCVSVGMSGILDMKEEIMNRPEIGLTCLMLSSRNLDLISTLLMIL